MTTGNQRGKNRFEAQRGTVTMKAVVPRDNGGYEMPDCRDVPVPVPEPGPDEVLIQVLAAGVNN